jgi:hypothetical protein
MGETGRRHRLHARVDTLATRRYPWPGAPLSIYAIVSHDITDPQSFAPDVAGVMPLIAGHGGEGGAARAWAGSGSAREWRPAGTPEGPADLQ